METLQYCATRVGLTAILLVVLVSVSCSSTPTTPTPPPPPPHRSLIRRRLAASKAFRARRSTPAGWRSISTILRRPTGRARSAVKCSPESGTTFPIGTTEVSCTATDTLNRAAGCSFNVTVSKLPTLSKTRFLAFGDSITAGEVTAPLGGSLVRGAGTITRQVVVPSASYPSVLLNTLRGRYAAQAGSIEVFNYGFGGEKVVKRARAFSPR